MEVILDYRSDDISWTNKIHKGKLVFICPFEECEAKISEKELGFDFSENIQEYSCDECGSSVTFEPSLPCNNLNLKLLYKK